MPRADRMILALALAVGAWQAGAASIDDRRAPSDYPSLEILQDQGGPLDGADPRAGLEAAQADAERQALFSALVPHGCRVAERDVERILAPEGFSFRFVSETLTTLVLDGVAKIDADGYLALPAGICPPADPAPTPRERVMSAFRDAGCTIDEAALEASVPIARPQLLAVIGPMIDAGDVTVADDTATLSPALCNAD